MATSDDPAWMSQWSTPKKFLAPYCPRVEGGDCHTLACAHRCGQRKAPYDITKFTCVVYEIAQKMGLIS